MDRSLVPLELGVELRAYKSTSSNRPAPRRPRNNLWSPSLKNGVSRATTPGLYDNPSSFLSALDGSPAFSYTIFPGIQDAFRAWALELFPDVFSTPTGVAWASFPLHGSWSVSCNRPFETVATEDLWLFCPPTEEEEEVGQDVPLMPWLGDSGYITPPPSPTPSLEENVHPPAPPPPSPTPSLEDAIHPTAPPAPPPTPSFAVLEPPASPGVSLLALPLSPPRGPAATPDFLPAFDQVSPAEVLVVEETHVAPVDDSAPSYDAASLSREEIDSAPKGQSFFAITRGYRVGVFVGPFERISPLVAMYEGCHFCGFETYGDAAAWFLEHALD
ncbi:hypothetical protein FA95DRAFT_1606121 [Auriscalpium vulgare]|uniref:Uncharacterized protein n=1 Tax=Auriscalpium vulgare TaxID=40419 RepID=A0ACB8RTD3_9AGAM|nr:hypothetical protein FA95DRAFT_1606121 [Auriscalpium vulgare]